MLGGDIFAAQNAVDEHTKLGVLKQSAAKIAPAVVGFYFNAGLFEKRYVSADCFSVYIDSVVVIKVFGYVVLCERMLEVAVGFKYLFNACQSQLLDSGLYMFFSPRLYYTCNSVPYLSHCCNCELSFYDSSPRFCPIAFSILMIRMCCLLGYVCL